MKLLSLHLMTWQFQTKIYLARSQMKRHEDFEYIL
jgi:hypothetical protein